MTLMCTHMRSSDWRVAGAPNLVWGPGIWGPETGVWGPGIWGPGVLGSGTPDLGSWGSGVPGPQIWGLEGSGGSQRGSYPETGFLGVRTPFSGKRPEMAKKGQKRPKKAKKGVLGARIWLLRAKKRPKSAKKCQKRPKSADSGTPAPGPQIPGS